MRKDTLELSDLIKCLIMVPRIYKEGSKGQSTNCPHAHKDQDTECKDSLISR